ncbi:hypothetical protein [Dactylosporangium matsuzakiense]|uniref:Uncharacterized protein n=1 Tax=Dactylosporangium matsuzakiense TaxID=53360 RepID=A0A9W6KWH2_9ACTN|nr:hypothetical protein [Dactylosporangium matsuzakiense]UWZ47998.1 hypothetical protein Dmats_17315 [Dactylosporangium matsuzakiense]GLL07685.1 hypothetical protein GCM10017581_094400 [Dactylosporangium matsuzakiense]
MTHQLFDDLIGPPPPSRVDVERIVAGVERTRRRRRVVLSAGAAVVLAVAALTAVVTHRDPPPRPMEQLGESPAAVAAVRNLGDIRDTIDREIGAAVPGLQWTRDWDSPARVQLGSFLLTERPFAIGGRSSLLEVHTRRYVAGDLCGGERDCAPVPTTVPGVSCIAVQGLAVRCADAATHGDVSMAIGKGGTQPVFDVRLLVPVAAWLAYRIQMP